MCSLKQQHTSEKHQAALQAASAVRTGEAASRLCQDARQAPWEAETICPSRLASDAQSKSQQPNLPLIAKQNAQPGRKLREREIEIPGNGRAPAESAVPSARRWPLSPASSPCGHKRARINTIQRNEFRGTKWGGGGSSGWSTRCGTNEILTATSWRAPSAGGVSSGTARPRPPAPARRRRSGACATSRAFGVFGLWARRSLRKCELWSGRWGLGVWLLFFIEENWREEDGTTAWRGTWEWPRARERITDLTFFKKKKRGEMNIQYCLCLCPCYYEKNL